MRAPRSPLLLLLCLSLSSLAACGSEGDASTDDLDLTSAERTVQTLADRAEHRLFVTLGDHSSPELAKSIVAAAKRGVDARAILRSTGDFDTTWQLQQQLEASGVDTDVRPDEPQGASLAVADGTAIVKSGTRAKRETRADVVDSIAAKYTGALDGPRAPGAGRLVDAGELRIHPMPDSGRARILELIATAKRTIDLEVYQVQDRAVVRALTDAAARGVRVRVMLEPKTVGFQNFEAVSKQLRAGGVDVSETPPEFNLHRNVDHAKFAILDGKELLFSSGNLVRSGLGGVTDTRYANRDYWIEDGRADSIRDAQKVFDADLARRSTRDDELASLVLTPDNANDKILALIRSARTRLLVANQSLSDEAIVAALIEAKGRGVDVKVLLGFQPDNAKNPATLAELSRAGVQAKALRKHYLHAKSIVADGRGYVGSQNFTGGGLRNNRELGEIIDEPALVRRLADTFDDDFARPQ